MKKNKKYEVLDVVYEDNKIIDICSNYEGHYDTLIDTTIINGEILMKEHKLLLDIDENKLMSDINDIYNKLSDE